MWGRGLYPRHATLAAVTAIRIPHRFEGPPGTGQGGYTAARVLDAIGGVGSVAFRSPIPLEEDLSLDQQAHDHWTLSASTGVTVLDITRWEPTWATISPVSIADATAARHRFEYSADNHPAHHCFSCGAQSGSMQVHAGPLSDGRYGTDWTVPEWASGDDGVVDHAVAWAAVDCTAAWFVCGSGDQRPAFTVQLAVEVLEPLVAGETYALVASQGDYPFEWNGRKRGACSAAFAADGRLMVRSRSFWVALP